MPAVPEELFLEAVNSLTVIDKNWIPQSAGSALYIRPFIFVDFFWDVFKLVSMGTLETPKDIKIKSRYVDEFECLLQGSTM